MKHLPFHQRQRLSAPLMLKQVSQGLSSLGLLLFGAGLGIIGYGWLASKASPTYAARADLSPILSSFSKLIPPLPTAQTPIAQAAQVTTDVSNATVCVKTSMPTGEDFCASGVSIDPQLAGISPSQGSVVLTNYHVVYDTNRPSLQLGGKGEVLKAEIIKQSPEYDLALLFVPQAQFSIAKLADSSPAKGTAVRAIGFPNNQPLTVKDSTVLGETQDCLAVSPCLALQQGTITFGNSGGPLEANGEVVGITQGEIRDEIAIPVEQVRQFLAGQTPASTNSNRYPVQGGPEFPSDRYPSYPDRYPSYPDHYPSPDRYPSYSDPQFPSRRQAPDFYPPFAHPPYGYPPDMPPPYAW